MIEACSFRIYAIAMLCTVSSSRSDLLAINGAVTKETPFLMHAEASLSPLGVREPRQWSTDSALK